MFCRCIHDRINSNRAFVHSSCGKQYGNKHWLRAYFKSILKSIAQWFRYQSFYHLPLRKKVHGTSKLWLTGHGEIWLENSATSHRTKTRIISQFCITDYKKDKHYIITRLHHNEARRCVAESVENTWQKQRHTRHTQDRALYCNMRQFPSLCSFDSVQLVTTREVPGHQKMRRKWEGWT